MSLTTGTGWVDITEPKRPTHVLADVWWHADSCWERDGWPATCAVHALPMPCAYERARPMTTYPVGTVPPSLAETDPVCLAILREMASVHEPCEPDETRGVCDTHERRLPCPFAVIADYVEAPTP